MCTRHCLYHVTAIEKFNELPLEAPAEPADPMILKVVGRMVEMRRQRLEELRRPRTGKKTARKRKPSQTTPT